MTWKPCRACGLSIYGNNPAFRTLDMMLDMGPFPLANRLTDSPRDPEKFPLQIYFCHNCGLIQLEDIVPRQEMFDSYTYMTRASETMVHHFNRYAEEMIGKMNLSKNDVVLDIGSNDGTLLKAFQRRGIQVLGIEPAKNMAELALAEGVPTRNEYFKGTEAVSLITANNILSHVGDLDHFIELVASSLKSDGAFAFELPWIADVLKNNTFDFFYHEHLSYFGFRPLARVLSRHGLRLEELKYEPNIHGGTFRGVAKPDSPPGKGFTYDYPEGIQNTFCKEMIGADYWTLKEFAERIPYIAVALRELLVSLRKTGHHIAGYGAPAKATTLLNYCKIGSDLIDYAIDTTPTKQAKFIPGTGIQIASHNHFQAHPPDYCLMLAWNYEREILEKEEEWVKNGGKFIIPFPEPRVVP